MAAFADSAAAAFADDDAAAAEERAAMWEYYRAARSAARGFLATPAVLAAVRCPECNCCGGEATGWDCRHHVAGCGALATGSAEDCTGGDWGCDFCTRCWDAERGGHHSGGRVVGECLGALRTAVEHGCYGDDLVEAFDQWEALSSGCQQAATTAAAAVCACEE